LARRGLAEKVAHLEGAMEARELELSHMRTERAETADIAARAQRDALKIIDRAQREAEALIDRAETEIERLRADQRRATQRAERRLELVNGFRAAIRRSLHGSMGYVERALVDMKSGLSELDAATSFDVSSDAPALPVSTVLADPPSRSRDVTSPAPPPPPIVTTTEPEEHPVVEATPPAAPVEEAVAADVDDDGRPGLRLVEHPTPEETLAAETTVSPTRVTVRAHPIRNYSTLATFEQQIAAIDFVDDVYVASFGDSVAELDLTLQRPAPLTAHLRKVVGHDVDIDSTDPSHIVLDLGRISDVG
jgi:hypothetical protein